MMSFNMVIVSKTIAINLPNDEEVQLKKNETTATKECNETEI